MKKVCVIILNYNHLEDLIETINSFKNQKYTNLEIIVVDNNSEDNSVDYIKNNYPEIKIIEINENLGWSGGNNVGIKYALKSNADFILLSNNDISISDNNVISELVKSLEKSNEIGIIGPAEFDYYNKNICINEGWILYPKSKFYFNKYRINYISKYTKNYKIVDNVSGSFMMINSKLFKQIGLIDENYFLYGEDADFCLRAWEKGYISVVRNDLKIYHKVSVSSGKNSPLKIYYTTRNLIYLIKKFKKTQKNHYYFILKFNYDLIKIILKVFVELKFKGKRIKILKSIFRALHHGLILKKIGDLNK